MPLATDVLLKLDGVSAYTAREAIDYVRAIPEAGWGKVQPRSHARTRIRFGKQEFYGAKGAQDLPPPIAALGEEAFESVRARLPQALAARFRPKNCVLNKYAKKKGVAKHRDPGDKWAPLVIGVTLMRRPDDPISAMQFESLPGAPTLENVRVGTPHRSVYAFFGDGFHRATHERVKGNAKQREDIYSFTFRCGESELE